MCEWDVNIPWIWPWNFGIWAWEGGVGPVNKFFNTGKICTKQVTLLESWILSEGRPAMGISFPLDKVFVWDSDLVFVLCFFLVLFSCSARGCFFFLVLLSTSSSFLVFCLRLLLSCFSVFFFFFLVFILLVTYGISDLLFNKRASVTSFCKVLLQNIFQTHKYWKQGSEHDL